MVFTKSLTLTDLETKLMVPNDFFRNLFPAQGQGSGGGGGGAVDFMVRNQNGLTWTFRLSNIRTGPDRYKLVVSAGWLQFVRDRKLKSGDCLTIYKEGGNDRMFRIEVKRRENSKGSYDWTRLV